MSPRKRLVKILTVVLGTPLASLAGGYIIAATTNDQSGITMAFMLLLGIFASFASLIMGLLVSAFSESLWGYYLPPILAALYLLYSYLVFLTG